MHGHRKRRGKLGFVGKPPKFTTGPIGPDRKPRIDGQSKPTGFVSKPVRKLKLPIRPEQVSPTARKKPTGGLLAGIKPRKRKVPTLPKKASATARAAVSKARPVRRRKKPVSSGGRGGFKPGGGAR